MFISMLKQQIPEEYKRDADIVFDEYGDDMNSVVNMSDKFDASFSINKYTMRIYNNPDTCLIGIEFSNGENEISSILHLA